jgi:uncharacterized membrane protein YccC
MTPLIVIQPNLNDAVRKSLKRAGGTLGGFAIAMTISLLIPSPWVTQVIGIVFVAAVLFAMQERWDYSVYTVILTVAIVLIEGSDTSIECVAVLRAIATISGVLIALLVVAIGSPIYRRRDREAARG